MLSLKNESDYCQNDKVPKGRFSAIDLSDNAAAWKVCKIANIAREGANPKRLAYSHWLRSCYFAYFNMATTFICLSERSIASRKPHWFASYLHLSCALLSLVKIKYNRITSWKKSVWVWKTKARLSNQNSKVLKCYNFSHTIITAASICFANLD